MIVRCAYLLLAGLGMLITATYAQADLWEWTEKHYVALGPGMDFADGTMAAGAYDEGVNTWQNDTAGYIEYGIAGSSPSTSNSQIAWTYETPDSAVRQVVLWDGSHYIPITNSTHDNYNPSLYNGTIAYSRDDGNDHEIFYWDGTQEHQITDNDIDDVHPSLYNGQIAWVRGDPDFFGDIILWDGTDETKLNQGNLFASGIPHLHDGKVVFSMGSFFSGDSEVYLWDNGNLQQITDDDVDNLNPVMHNGMIAWSVPAGPADGPDGSPGYFDINKIQIYDGSQIYDGPDIEPTTFSYDPQTDYLSNDITGIHLDGDVLTVGYERLHVSWRYQQFNGTWSWNQGWFTEAVVASTIVPEPTTVVLLSVVLPFVFARRGT